VRRTVWKGSAGRSNKPIERTRRRSLWAAALPISCYSFGERAHIQVVSTDLEEELLRKPNPIVEWE
jgi:hypothetical protein